MNRSYGILPTLGAASIIGTIYTADYFGISPNRSDNTEQWQEAEDVIHSKGGGGLTFPYGRIAVNGAITLRDGVHRLGAGRGATIIDTSEKGFFSYTSPLFLAQGDGFYNVVNVTDDCGFGTTNVCAIPVDDITGFEPGSLIAIYSDEVVYTSATIGEYARVHWADSGVVYLKLPLTYKYTKSGHTIKLARVSTISGTIQNLTLKGSGINPAGLPSPLYTGTPSESLNTNQRGDLGLEVRFGENFIVDGVEFIGLEQRAVTLACCTDTWMQRCRVKFDAINQLSQYGCAVGGMAANVNVSSNVFINGRHSFTTISTPSLNFDYFRGMPTGILVYGNFSEGPWVYAFDTHPAGSGISFIANKIKSQSGGIELRTPNSSVLGNDIECPVGTTGQPGLAFNHCITVQGGLANVEVGDNRCRGGNNGLLVNGDALVRGSSISICANMFNDMFNGAINIDNYDRVTCNDNECGTMHSSATNGANITIQDCKRGQCNANDIELNTTSNKIGVWLAAATAGATSDFTVGGNKVSDLGGGGTITGVYLADNVTYSTVGINHALTCDVPLRMGSGPTNVAPPGGLGANDLGLITVSSGVITVPYVSGMCYATIDCVDSDEDLNTINGGGDGMFIMFRGNSSSHRVTFKDNGTSLSLPADFKLTTSSYTITLGCKNGVWYQAASSQN